MKKFLQILMVLAALTVPWVTQAQVTINLDSYTFIDSTTTFSSISTTGTQLTSLETDDASTSVLLPFTFSFGGESYDSIMVSSNAQIGLGAANPTTTGYYEVNTNSMSIIVPMGHDMNLSSTDGGGHVYWTTLGTTPNRTFVIEYNHIRPYSGYASSYYTFQVCLHENGNMDFIYDTCVSGYTQSNYCFIREHIASSYVALSGTWASPTFTSGIGGSSIGTLAINSSSVPQVGRMFSFRRPDVSCNRPQQMWVTDLTATTATVHWLDTTDASSWEFEYDTAGFALGTGITTTESADSVILTGLTPQTNYTCYLRSNCTNGGYSAYIINSFTTACVAIPHDSLPYTESFENWATGSTGAGTAGPCWSYVSNYSTVSTNYHYPYCYSGTASDGNNSFYFYKQGSSYYGYIVMPLFEDSIQNLQFSCDVRNNTYANSTYAVQLGVMTNPSDYTTFIPITTIYPTTTSQWQPKEIPLSSYMGPQGYLALMAPTTSEYNYTFIDNIIVEPCPTCGHISNLAAQVSGSSAIFSWTPHSSVGVYDGAVIEYRDASTTTWTSVSTTNTYYVLSGLAPSTSYEARVAALCTAGDTSTWRTINFTTTPLVGGCEDNPIGSGTTTNSYLPSYSFYKYGFSQQIYRASEINGSGLITGIQLHAAGHAQDRSWDIYLAHTQDTSVNEWIMDSNKVLVYSGTPTMTANSWNEIQFTTPFAYNGTDNLLLIIDDNTGSYVSGNAFYVDALPTGCSSRYVYSDGTNYDPDNLTVTGTAVSSRNNIIFTVCDTTSTCVAPNVYASAVGATSVDFVWAAGDQESSWALYYKAESDSTYTYETTSTSDSYTYTNLQPNTNYSFRFYSLCGSDSNFRALSIRTTCVTIDSFPYVENFDNVATGWMGYTLSCWSEGNTYSYYATTYPSVSSSYNDDTVAGHSLYMYNYVYYTNGYYAYAAMPPIDTTVIPMDTVVVRFSARRSSDECDVLVGVMTDPNDFSTFTVVDTVSIGVANTWEPKEVSLANYHGTGTSIAFVAINTRGSLQNYTNFYLDNIKLVYQPSCPRPIELNAVNITSITADVTWSNDGSGNYQVEWGPHSFTQGTGTLTFVNDTMISLSGLTANTAYDIYVRSLCSASDTSEWSFCYTFRSACGTIDSIPYVENFDGYNTGWMGLEMPCWTTEYTYTYYATSYPSISSSQNYPTAGSGNSLYIYGYLYGTNYYMQFASPVIDTMAVDLSNVMLSFYMATTTTSYVTNVIVGMADSIGSYASFTPIDTIQPTYGVWTLEEIPLNNYTGTGTRVAFRVEPGGASASTYGYIYMDNFTLDTLPSCIHPNHLHQITNTATSVTIGWNERGSATEWEVSYDTSSTFLPANGTHVSVYTNPTANIGNLISGQTYYFYVRSVCGSGDSSRWVGPFSAVPNTWSMRANQTDTIYMCGGHVYDDGGVTGTYSANQNSTLIIYPDTSSMAVSISGTVYIEGYTWDKLFIYDGVGVTGTALVSLQGTSYSSGINVNATSTTGPLTLVFTTDGSGEYSGWDFYVNCVSNTCPAVSNVRADAAGTTSISLTWDTVTSAQLWEVEYGAVDFAQGTGTTLYTTTFPVTISNLSAMTDYDFYVRPICSSTDTGAWSFATTLGTTVCDNSTTITTSTGSATTSYVPGYPVYNYSYSQTIIDSAQLVGAGNISGFAFYANGSDGSAYMTNCQVYLGHTTKSSFTSSSDYVPVTDTTFTLVYSGDLAYETGWNMFYLDTAFMYDGTSNLIIAVDRNTGSWTSGSTFAATTCSSSKTLFSYSDTYNPDPTNMTSYSGSKGIGTYQANFQLLSCNGAACAVPQLVSNVLSYDSATITWTGESTDYEVAVKAASDATWPAETAVSAYTYTFGGLNPATTYLYRIRQICDSANISEWYEGTFITDSLPCFAPANVTATPQGTTADIDWTPGSTESSWLVNVYNSTFNRTYTATEHPYTVTDLIPDVTYNVKVSAICGNATDTSDWSTPIIFSTESCDPVTNVTVSSLNSTGATITWTAGENNTGSWQLEYGFADFGQGEGTSINTTTNSATLTGLMSGQAYDVYVRAICGPNYNSSWSTRVRFTPVGIENVIGGTQLNLYPNPTTGSTTITLSGVQGSVTLTIVDMSGRTVKTETMECSGDCAKKLDVNNLSQGAYFVRVSGENVNIVKKLIVK